MDVRSLIPLNPRDYLILFALVSGRLHGYGIVKEVERESCGKVILDPANLYRSIKRLIRDRLVDEADPGELPEPGTERRRYYTITDLGKQAVALEATRLAELTESARRKRLIPSGESGS
jgi:DNA-binding PadR family transcriptional regulator